MWLIFFRSLKDEKKTLRLFGTHSFSLKKFCPLIEVILKYTKDLGIDLEARNNQERTPLHYLYATRCKENVTKFIEVAKRVYNIEFNLHAILFDYDVIVTIELPSRGS